MTFQSVRLRRCWLRLPSFTMHPEPLSAGDNEMQLVLRSTTVKSAEKLPMPSDKRQINCVLGGTVGLGLFVIVFRVPSSSSKTEAPRPDCDYGMELSCTCSL